MLATPLPTSISSFILKHPGWEDVDRASLASEPGFAVPTSDWGDLQTSTYRVIRRFCPQARDVIPPSELNEGAIRAVMDQLAPEDIPDSSIEKIPTHELTTSGGPLASFFAALGTILAKSPTENEPIRVQPPRDAKKHQRTVSVETTASRDSDIQNHGLRVKPERVTEILVLQFLQGIVGTYYSRKYPNRDNLPRITEFRPGGHSITFDMFSTEQTCTSINDGSLVLMKFDTEGNWIPASSIPACSIEVKREYSIVDKGDDTILVKDANTIAQQAGEMVALAHAWSGILSSPFYVFIITGAQQRVSLSSAKITDDYQTYIGGEASGGGARAVPDDDIADLFLEMRETPFFNLAKSGDRKEFASIILSLVEYQNSTLVKAVR